MYVHVSVCVHKKECVKCVKIAIFFMWSHLISCHFVRLHFNSSVSGNSTAGNTLISLPELRFHMEGQSVCVCVCVCACVCLCELAE